MKAKIKEFNHSVLRLPISLLLSSLIPLEDTGFSGSFER